jgi:HEAT repeat protein
MEWVWEAQMSLIDDARNMINRGQADEARSALLEAASDPHPKPGARRAFEELFPLTPYQREWMAGTLMKLVSTDAAARARAAKELGRAARSEMSYEQQDRIGDPRCLDYLVPAMASQDPKVTENSTSAVARAALFYYRDWRAWKPALGLLKSKRQSIRRLAVDVAAYLGRERAVDAILPLFADEAERVRT